MKLGLFAVYDICSGVYDGPFKARTDAEAQRTFATIAVDAEHPIGQNPEDYTLMRVGTWNDGTGEIEVQSPVAVITALECVSASRQIEAGALEVVGNA